MSLSHFYYLLIFPLDFGCNATEHKNTRKKWRRSCCCSNLKTGSGLISAGDLRNETNLDGDTKQYCTLSFASSWGQVQVCLWSSRCNVSSLVWSVGWNRLWSVTSIYFIFLFFSSSPFLMGENFKNLIHSGDLFICVALTDLWFMGIRFRFWFVIREMFGF